MNRVLRRDLLALRARDAEKREELVRRGELFDGYHPEMEAVHTCNARALEHILDRHGWPGLRDVGEEGAEAAWIVAQHAIGEPDFQRRCLELLERAVGAGEAPPAFRALLIDRIRFNERRPQLYGTQFDWDANGCMSPWPIEDAANVEARRRAVGLPPLAETIPRVRARAEGEGARPPASYAARQAEIEDWAARVGWLETS